MSGSSSTEVQVQPELHGDSAGPRPRRDDGLSVSQQERIEHAVARCRAQNGLDVSVLVGDLQLDGAADSFRSGAERLHAALGERAHGAVLVVVAPGQRRVEIVTGPAARRRVPDRVAGLVVLSMLTAFRGGDLAGGVIDGLRQIAQAAGTAPALPPLQQAPGHEVASQH